MIGIYKIISPSGRIYIGQSINVNDRLRHHQKNPDKNLVKLYNSFMKYGIEAHTFEVLNIFNEDISQHYLNMFEQLHAANEIIKGKQLLNIRRPGSNGALSQESKDKISRAKKGKTAWNKGIPMSIEQRHLLSEIKKGKCPDSLKVSCKRRYKAIIQFDKEGNFIKEWSSIQLASDTLNINNANLVQSVKNGRCKAGGYIWKYKNEKK